MHHLLHPLPPMVTHILSFQKTMSDSEQPPMVTHILSIQKTMSESAAATHGTHILSIQKTMSNRAEEVILSAYDEREYLLTDLARLPRQRRVTNARGKRGEMRSMSIPAKTFISLWGVHQ